MVKVRILRHSERTDYTEPYKWVFYTGYCSNDSPLTSRGFDMANTKAKLLANDPDFKPQVIYTSPYTRTIQTAVQMKTIFNDADVIIENLLAEYQESYVHKINIYPTGIPIYNADGNNFNFPESYADLEKRVMYIIPKLIKKRSSDIIIITHGEVVKVFISYLQQMFPDKLLDPGRTPYLTCIYFEYDTDTDTINKESVKLG